MANTQVDEKLMEKLRQILALTTSPVEGEAQAAAAMLRKFLTKYNLEMADLEQKGSRAGSQVHEQGYDLGKAAFKWKLDLANSIASHYYCLPLVDTYAKTVKFVGRPENVESLKMLYGWLIDQIKRISSEERKRHELLTGEHVDPLRWQVNFGIGCVARLGKRLKELKMAEALDVQTTALTLHHDAEINDWMETTYGYRPDGSETKAQREARERREAARREDEELFARDPEAYYQKYPQMRPEALERRAKESAEWMAKWQKEREEKEERARKRREKNAGKPGYDSEGYRVRYMSHAAWEREQQGQRANMAGRGAADKVNLRPFLETGAGKEKLGDG